MEDWIKNLAQDTINQSVSKNFNEGKDIISIPDINKEELNAKDLKFERLKSAVNRIYCKLENSIKVFNIYSSDSKRIKIMLLSELRAEMGFLLIQGTCILRIDNNMNNSLDVYAISKNDYQVIAKKMDSYFPKQDNLGKLLWSNGNKEFSEDYLVKNLLQQLCYLSNLTSKKGAARKG